MNAVAQADSHEAARRETNLWRGPFLRGLFCESDGSPSIENVLSLMLVIAAIFFVGFIVVRTRELPEASRLTALAALCAAHHFSNKLGDTISSFGGKT